MPVKEPEYDALRVGLERELVRVGEVHALKDTDTLRAPEPLPVREGEGETLRHPEVEGDRVAGGETLR